MDEEDIIRSFNLYSAAQSLVERSACLKLQHVRIATALLVLLVIIVLTAIFSPATFIKSEADPIRLKIPILPVRAFKGGIIMTDFRSKSWCFIDEHGKVVIPALWDWAGDFYDGLAAISQKGKIGFIDTTGKIVIAPQWNFASDFDKGASQVDQYGYIDKKGNALQAPPPHWSFYHNNSSGLTITRKGNDLSGPYDLFGVTGIRGIIVIKVEWEQITEYRGYFLAMRMVNPSLNPHGNNIPGSEEFPAEAAWFDHDGKMIWHTP